MLVTQTQRCLGGCSGRSGCSVGRVIVLEFGGGADCMLVCSRYHTQVDPDHHIPQVIVDSQGCERLWHFTDDELAVSLLKEEPSVVVLQEVFVSPPIGLHGLAMVRMLDVSKNIYQAPGFAVVSSGSSPPLLNNPSPFCFVDEFAIHHAFTSSNVESCRVSAHHLFMVLRPQKDRVHL